MSTIDTSTLLAAYQLTQLLEGLAQPQQQVAAPTPAPADALMQFLQLLMQQPAAAPTSYYPSLPAIPQGYYHPQQQAAYAPQQGYYPQQQQAAYNPYAPQQGYYPQQQQPAYNPYGQAGGSSIFGSGAFSQDKQKAYTDAMDLLYNSPYGVRGGNKTAIDILNGGRGY